MNAQSQQMKRIIETFELGVAAILIGILAFVVIGACAALVPVYWIIDWDARRLAEGDKWTS